MAVLLVRTTLSNFFEPLFLKKRRNLFGFQDGDVGHLTHSNRLNAYELRLQGWFAVLQKHSDDFL